MITLQNFSQLMFPVARTGFEEVQAAGPTDPRLRNPHQWADASRKQLLAFASGIDRPESYGWILLADADCIVLRNLDHLFASEGDVLVSRSARIPDPGFVAVRGGAFRDFVAQLRENGGLTRQGLGKVIDSGRWRIRDFERGEVLRPGDPGVSLQNLAEAAVIHFSGMSPEYKQKFVFAFHMMAVYGDEGGLFFDMLEA